MSLIRRMGCNYKGGRAGGLGIAGFRKKASGCWERGEREIRKWGRIGELRIKVCWRLERRLEKVSWWKTVGPPCFGSKEGNKTPVWKKGGKGGWAGVEDSPAITVSRVRARVLSVLLWPGWGWRCSFPRASLNQAPSALPGSTLGMQISPPWYPGSSDAEAATGSQGLWKRHQVGTEEKPSGGSGVPDEKEHDRVSV